MWNVKNVQPQKFLSYETPSVCPLSPQPTAAAMGHLRDILLLPSHYKLY